MKTSFESFIDPLILRVEAWLQKLSRTKYGRIKTALAIGTMLFVISGVIAIFFAEIIPLISHFVVTILPAVNSTIGRVLLIWVFCVGVVYLAGRI